MQITAIKTKKVTLGDDLYKILDQTVTNLQEKSIVVITSKIVSICEGNVIRTGTINKHQLIKQEADYYFLRHHDLYDVTVTIKDNFLAVGAGIDESNGNGHYVLWPKNPQKSVNEIRKYLMKKFKLKHLGVIITDSKTHPLRWGVTGFPIAHSGFKALNDFIGKKDLFNYTLKQTKVGISEGLAAAAVVVMGESNEQTPIAIIQNVPFVKFQKRNPAKKELQDLIISIKDDIYAPLLENVKWEKEN